MNKLDLLKNELKEILYNNIHNFQPEQAVKVLDIINNGKKQKVISTIKKINGNKDNEDIIINKNKNLKKILIKKEIKILNKNNEDELIKYFRNLNKNEQEKIRKRETKKLEKTNVIIKDTDYYYDKTNRDGLGYDINDKNNDKDVDIRKIVIKGKNYFKNVALSKEYIINSKVKIIDIYLFLNKLKDDVINDIDNIRIDKFEDNIKVIFVIKVVFIY
jgi:hypothetical protein